MENISQNTDEVRNGGNGNHANTYYDFTPILRNKRKSPRKSFLPSIIISEDQTSDVIPEKIDETKFGPEGESTSNKLKNVEDSKIQGDPGKSNLEKLFDNLSEDDESINQKYNYIVIFPPEKKYHIRPYNIGQFWESYCQLINTSIGDRPLERNKLKKSYFQSLKSWFV